MADRFADSLSRSTTSLVVGHALNSGTRMIAIFSCGEQCDRPDESKMPLRLAFSLKVVFNDPTMQPQIEQLAERPDLLPAVAEWIYREWWTDVEGASVGTLADLLRAHSVPHRIPLTLIASVDRRPVGTATLLAHDVGTEEWPDLTPWLAAVYVVPDHRRRGIGAALIQAIVESAAAFGVGTLYLTTVDQEAYYARRNWNVIHRGEQKVVMSRTTG